MAMIHGMKPNSGIKPSIATYDPPHPEERAGDTAISSLSQAQDKDTALLGMVDHQVDVAMSALSINDSRKAVAVLRRAHQLSQQHSSPPLPIAKLALATVRLALCATLSHIGRHDQAFAEASEAKREIEEIWRTMQAASMEQEEADAIGITTKPAAPLRKMMRTPPEWLSRVVEVAVQATLAMALELEYESPKKDLMHAPLSPQQPAKVGQPQPPPTRTEEIAELHEEAARLARELLPEESEVRQAAERTCLQAQLRHEVRHTTKLRPGNNSMLAPVPLASPSKKESNDARPRALPVRVPDLKDPMFKLGTKPPEDQDGNIRRWNGTWAPPPGNILHYATRTPTVRRSASQPASPASGSGQATSSQTTPDAPEAASGGGGNKGNPFADWTNTMTDVNRMSYAQLTARTSEGQAQMLGKLKLQTRQFKSLDMKEMEDSLYENRVTFCKSGMAMTAGTKKKEDAWKAKAWQFTEAGKGRVGSPSASTQSASTMKGLLKQYRRAVKESDTIDHLKLDLKLAMGKQEGSQ